MKEIVMKFAGKCAACVVLGLVLLLVAEPAAAQKKNKNQPATNTPSSTDSSPLPVPDTQAVERAVGEYLGYWQIGDLDSLHKYCADDIVVVSGDWEQPLIGWQNYARAYQAQRSQVTGGRMDRSNTYIKVNGNSAWATYQFDYVATVEGQVAEFRGHTTLVLNKQADRWVIVLNHSSVVSTSEMTKPAPLAQQPAQSH